MNLRPVLLMLGKLKEWVMLDIICLHRRYSCRTFLRVYGSVSIPSVRRPAPIICRCTGCHYTGYRDARGRCRRCHAAASSPTAEPAAQLGGADCLAGFPLSGQPVANLHYLRQRRAPDDTILSGIISGQQQYRHCRGRVYRQYFGAIHQSYSVIYPAAQHTIQVRAGLRTRILLLRLITGLAVGRCWICLLSHSPCR